MSSTEKQDILLCSELCKDALLYILSLVCLFCDLLSCFDHGNPVLSLWCTCMLPSDDLCQLRVRKKVVTEPSEVSCQVERFSYTMQKMIVKCNEV